MRWAEEYDYVVVGAGSAGCVVAARLTEDPSTTVLVVEAGGSNRDPRISLPGAQGFVVNSNHDWKFWTEPQAGANGRRYFLPRGKTVGGTGSINTSIYIRGHAGDYDEWERLGATGWGWRDCLPYFVKSEHNTRGADDFHGADGPLWVSDQDDPNELTRRYVEAAAGAGLERNDDFNGAAQAGVGLYQVTHKRGRRWSTADAFLLPALERPNLTATTRALVHRIAFEDGRAAGVVFSRGKDVRAVRARREVVLCAGAIGSPHLLLLSGIGPADHLRSFGIDVVADVPEVGHNFQDHLHSPIVMEAEPNLGLVMPKTAGHWLGLMRKAVDYATSRKGMFASNLAEGGGFVALDAPDDRPNVQFHFAPGFAAPPPGYAEKGRWAYSLLPCVLRPESRGHLRLRSSLPDQPPLIDPGFLSAQADVDTIVRGLELAREIAQSPAFGTVGRELVPGPGADLEAHVRNHSWTVHHATSTCRMGSDDRAVVDPELRVRGIDGLRVADASVMPRVIGGNTNAPAIMIGERAADLLLGLRSTPLTH